MGFVFFCRWDKGKKNAVHKTGLGEKISYLRIGGRTCAFVDERQQLPLEEVTIAFINIKIHI
jgi:hypothetical protein